jgi:hypothetical protein
MKSIQPALPWFTLWVCAVFLAACGSPGYNDNPSQQMADAKLGCLAATDFFAVRFSVHVQSPKENQDPRLKRQSYRAYCEDIPTSGTLFFTADLVGDALRRTPMGIRVVEQTSADDESQAENFNGLRTLFELPPKAYPNGVIEAHFETAKTGYYAIHLIRGGNDAASEAGKLIIPLKVGVASGIKRLTAPILSLFGIAAGLGIGLVAVRNRRRHKIP